MYSWVVNASRGGRAFGIPWHSFFAGILDLIFLPQSQFFQILMAYLIPITQGTVLLPVWSSDNPADHLIYLCFISPPFRPLKQTKLLLQLVDWDRFSRHVRKRSSVASRIRVRWAYDFRNRFVLICLNTSLHLHFIYCNLLLHYSTRFFTVKYKRVFYSLRVH